MDKFVERRRKKEARLPLELARQLFYHDPELGWLMWKVSPAKNVKAGAVAGCINKDHGYVQVRVGGEGFQVHRLIWLLEKGEWPEDEVDHENGDRSDNRLKNLRSCTSAVEQQQNTKVKSTNTSGHPNVHRWKYGWVVGVMSNGVRKRKKIKDYDKACIYAEKLKAELHSFNPVHRKG